MSECLLRANCHALFVISATLDLHHRHGFNSMQND